jgi:hypothetical protein
MVFGNRVPFEQMSFLANLSSNLPHIPSLPKVQAPGFLKKTIEIGFPEELDVKKYYDVPLHLWAQVMVYIPITQYANIASCSKFFYAIITTDTIYSHHLKTMKLGDCTQRTEWTFPKSHASVPSTILDTSTTEKDKGNSTSTLPSGTSTICESISGTTGSLEFVGNLNSEKAFATFKEIYARLLPYYLDFRRESREPLVYKHYRQKIYIAGMLRKLRLFGTILVVGDYSRVSITECSSRPKPTYVSR